MDEQNNGPMDRLKNRVEELKRLVAEELLPELEELDRMIKTDDLTQVLNRRAMISQLEGLFEEARQGRSHSVRRQHIVVDDFCVLFLDVDNFKSINDKFGHAAGDVILKRVAEVLLGSVRKIDVVGRYGGEEFVAAFPGMDEDHGFEKGDRICRLIEKNVLLPDKTPVTVSIGVASLYTSKVTNLEDLFKAADAAMYRAKQEGKNRVARWSKTHTM